MSIDGFCKEKKSILRSKQSILIKEKKRNRLFWFLSHFKENRAKK